MKQASYTWIYLVLKSISQNKHTIYEKTLFYNPWAHSWSFIIFPQWECRTAGAIILQPFNIHFFLLWECRPVGGIVSLALCSLTHKIHIFFISWLQHDCGTTGASVQCHAIVAGYPEVDPEKPTTARLMFFSNIISPPIHTYDSIIDAREREIRL